MTAQIHVIHKTDNSKHAVCNIDESALPALDASSVRIRTELISLTSNNLTMALGGNQMRYWDAYPVPAGVPEPYSNNEEWGIVMAWGYGKVEQSTIDGIAPGSLLWGVWPTSSHAVDLKLRAAEPQGHWIEVSPHRQYLLAAYNRFELETASDRTAMKMKALCNPLWQASYLLNHGTFDVPKVHPFGFGEPWSEADADLSSAVVISLSASSKTGRGFSWALANDRDASQKGPLALLQISSAPETLSQFPNATLPIKSASYKDTGLVEWVRSQQPSRIVMVDFGAADRYMKTLAAEVAEIAPLTTVIVGYEAKVYSAEDLQERSEITNALAPVYLNTSGLRDKVVETTTPKEFFARQDSAWDRYYKEGGYGDVQLRTLGAVAGDEGIEGAWSDLCGRKVSPNTGIVIDLSGK